MANQDGSPKLTVKKWILRVRCYDPSESGGCSGAQNDVVFMLWQKRQNITRVYLWFTYETRDIKTLHSALKVLSCGVVLGVLGFAALLLRRM